MALQNIVKKKKKKFLFHLPVGQQSQRETLGTKLEKDWPVRKHLTVGEKNIINESLINRRKIIPASAH